MAQPVLHLPLQPVVPKVAFGDTSFFRIKLTHLGPGLDIADGPFPAWCSDQFAEVNLDGQAYTLLNSYDTLPASAASSNWPMVNWVLNHKPQPANPANTDLVQEVIWKLLNGRYYQQDPSPGQKANWDGLYGRALSEGGGFVPKGGQTVAVLLYVDGFTDPATNKIQDLMLELPVPLDCSAFTANAFGLDGSVPPPGSHVWFNSKIRVRGLGNQPVTISFRNQSIHWMADEEYALPVPNSVITISPDVIRAGTTFDPDTNTWRTAVPLAAGSREIFLSGLSFAVPAEFSMGWDRVAWQGTISADQFGIGVQWNWSAAVSASVTANGSGGKRRGVSSSGTWSPAADVTPVCGHGGGQPLP